LLEAPKSSHSAKHQPENKQNMLRLNENDNLVYFPLLLPGLGAAEMSADEPEPTKQQQQQQQLRRSSLKRFVSVEQEPPKKKRRVEFNSSFPSLHHRENQEDFYITPEERKALWYSRGDLCEMKRSAKRFCASIDVEDELFRAYSVVPNNATTTKADQELENAAKAFALYQSTAFQVQRGLERWSSQLYLLSRCVTIVQVRTEVLLEQTSQSIDSSSCSSNLIDPARLAAVYQSASAPSARYARVLGLADAAAALRDDFSSPIDS
jgi:hypothetical protein